MTSDNVRHLHVLAGNEPGRPEPEPVGVSFRQTHSGARMVYVSLSVPLGGIARKAVVCQSPQITLDYDSNDHVVGLEILA